MLRQEIDKNQQMCAQFLKQCQIITNLRVTVMDVVNVTSNQLQRLLTAVDESCTVPDNNAKKNTNDVTCQFNRRQSKLVSQSRPRDRMGTDRQFCANLSVLSEEEMDQTIEIAVDVHRSMDDGTFLLFQR